MILDALVKVNGRRTRAAQLLGWGRSTLWRKMKHYGIVSDEGSTPMRKVLLVLDGNDIAPRFDLALELLIVSLGNDAKPVERRDIVLARPSAEALCRTVTSENVQTVICGGIEKKYSAVSWLEECGGNPLGHRICGSCRQPVSKRRSEVRRFAF